MLLRHNIDTNRVTRPQAEPPSLSTVRRGYEGALEIHQDTAGFRVNHKVFWMRVSGMMSSERRLSGGMKLRRKAIKRSLAHKKGESATDRKRGL